MHRRARKETGSRRRFTHDVDLLCAVSERYNVGLTWLECRVMIQGIYVSALRNKRQRKHAALCRGKKNHTKSILNAPVLHGRSQNGTKTGPKRD